MKVLIAIPMVLSLFLGDTLANQKPADVFQAMLKNATLNGSWAPVAKGAVGNDRKDGYRIVRAVPKGGDDWNIVSRTKHQGRMVDYPIPVKVHFAGDTAVMLLNNVPVGDGGVWSARVLFHADVYVGSWWSPNREKSGIVSGTITRKGK